jgi:hypothetical protein
VSERVEDRVHLDPPSCLRAGGAARQGAEVDDVEASRAQLEAKGVTFVVEMLDPGFYQAIFRDPDGNPLILRHRYGPGPA